MNNDIKKLKFSGVTPRYSLLAQDLGSADTFFYASLAVAVLFVILLLGVAFGEDVAGAMLLLAMLGWVGLSVITGNERDKKRTESLKKFAAQNGFEFKQSQNNWGPGSMFMHGDRKHMKNIVSGKLSDIEFRLYDFGYWKGNGKTERSYEVMVMDFNLPHALPHLVIDALAEPGKFSQSTLPINFDKSQRIELEGDFYKYFTLYAPDKTNIEALTLIAPDVMQTLMDHAWACDIEIVDKKLYFYWPDNRITAGNMRAKFEAARAILDELKPVLMRKHRLQANRKALLSSPPQTTSRLKKFSWKPYVIGGVALYYLAAITELFVKPSSGFARALLLLTVLVEVAIAFLIIKWLWRQYTKYQDRSVLKKRSRNDQ